MISEATASEIAAAIHDWQKRNSIPDEQMIELLKSIAALKGNKSFAASVQALLEYFELLL